MIIFRSQWAVENRLNAGARLKAVTPVLHLRAGARMNVPAARANTSGWIRHALGSDQARLVEFPGPGDTLGTALAHQQQTDPFQ